VAVLRRRLGHKDHKTAKEVATKAYELGINFFDTTAVYGRGRSEEFPGRAIKELGLRSQSTLPQRYQGSGYAEWIF